jgi:hypothetical protein
VNRRYKGAVSDRDIDRYFPVRISIMIGMGLPAREWSAKYSSMVAWLAQTAGGGHAVLSSTAPGLPDTMRVLFASFDDARAFVDRFEVPIAPLGENPKR